MRDGVGKWNLRRWLEKNLLDGAAIRAEARFTVPVGDWIKGRGSALGRWWRRQPGVLEIAHPERVERAVP